MWQHKWPPIQFVVVVGHFGVEYVDKEHVKHMSGVLKRYNDISEEQEGKQCAGIDLE